MGNNGWVNAQRPWGVSLAGWATLLSLAALCAGYFWLQRVPPVPVELVSVVYGQVTESLDEDGLVRSDVEVALRPQAMGHIARFHVRSGERVQRGQLVAELDAADIQASLEQAQAQLEVARATVGEARASLEALTQRTSAEIDNAVAARDQSYFQYRKAQSGSRPEEVERGAAAVRESQARYQEAERDYGRKLRLLQAGAISRRELDAADSQQKMTRAALEQAGHHLALLRRGTRWEEKGSAQADLQRNQAQVRMAQAQRQQIELSRRQLESALHRVNAAQAEERRARAMLDKSWLRAPTAGRVELENLQVGDTVTQNTTVARVVDPDKIWLEILVDEADRGKVKVGQSVQVVCDAYAGEVFPGRLGRIDASAFLKRELRNTPTQDEDRVFRGRVEFQGSATPSPAAPFPQGRGTQQGKGSPKGKLFPGMSVFSQVVLSQHDHLLTVTRLALIQREGQWMVYQVEGGRAHQRYVKIGRRDDNSAEVLEGLKEGDQVVINPSNVDDGKAVVPKVRPKATP